MEGIFETELRAGAELGWPGNGMLLGRAHASKTSRSPPTNHCLSNSHRLTGKYCAEIDLAIADANPATFSHAYRAVV
jgi:hypothetical protein